MAARNAPANSTRMHLGQPFRDLGPVLIRLGQSSILGNEFQNFFLPKVAQLAEAVLRNQVTISLCAIKYVLIN